MSPKKWNAIYTIETLPASATYRTTIYTVSQGNNISPALFPLLRDRKNLCILISSPKNFFFHSNVSSLQLDSFFSATNVIIIIYFSMAVRHAGPVKTVVESIDRGKSAHVWYFEQEGLGGRRRGRADLCANCALNAALHSVASR